MGERANGRMGEAACGRVGVLVLDRFGGRGSKMYPAAGLFSLGAWLV